MLRVDHLAKPGGMPCSYLNREGAGCSIHDTRPPICRAYRCFWLGGGLDEGDRPDRLGALLDLVQAGGSPLLAIREARPGVFDSSPRLKEIAERVRQTTPVRVTDAGDVMDPDRPYRLLLADRIEHRVAGDTVEVWRSGERVESLQRSWLERRLRWIGASLTRRRLRRRGIA